MPYPPTPTFVTRKLAVEDVTYSVMLTGVSVVVILSINPQHTKLLVSLTKQAPQCPRESLLKKGWVKGGRLGGQRRVNPPSTGTFDNAKKDATRADEKAVI